MDRHKLWTTNTLHFIDGNLNAQRYRGEVLMPIVVPFIRRHHLMFQHDNAQPHVARICTKFLEAENVPVLPWPANSPDISPIEHVWDALDRCVRQHVSFPASICQQHTILHPTAGLPLKLSRIGPWMVDQMLLEVVLEALFPLV